MIHPLQSRCFLICVCVFFLKQPHLFVSSDFLLKVYNSLVLLSSGVLNKASLKVSCYLHIWKPSLQTSNIKVWSEFLRFLFAYVPMFLKIIDVIPKHTLSTVRGTY